VTRPKVHSDPQFVDPLAEPTTHRRIWSAYLKRDMTRAAFARAVNVDYSTAFNWDMGKATPDLGTFLRICSVVGYTPNEIAYGHSAVPGERKALKEDEISLAWHDSGAPHEAATTLFQFKSGDGRYIFMTRTFVRAYFDKFAQVFDRPKDNALVAHEQSLIHATQSDALVHAVTLGAHPVAPPTAAAKKKRKAAPKRKR